MAKKKEAIQQDAASAEATPVSTEGVIVEEAPIVEETEAPVSDRDQVMSVLAKKQRNINAGLPPEQGLLPDDEVEGVIVDPVVGDDLPPVVDDESVVAPPPVIDDELVTLKVNGQDVQVTQAEVDAAGGVAAIQKTMSGDQKLAAAAEERRQLEEDQGKVAQVIEDNRQLREEITGLRDLITKQTETGDLGTVESSEELQARAKEITDKFFLGDAAELQTAVESILEAAAKPATAAQPQEIDTNLIATQVAENMRVEAERSEAVAEFETKHPDLNSPGRRNYVNDLTKDLSKKNPLWGPKQVIQEAVKTARINLELPAPTPVVDDPGSLANKREQKRTTVDTIPAAHERKEIVQKGKQPKTPQEIFKEMQSRRSHS